MAFDSPCGRRTGITAVDRLTIVAHDHFDKIIEEANSGQSIITAGVYIGRDIDTNPPPGFAHYP